MVDPIDDPENLEDSRVALLVKVWDDGEAEMIRQILLDYGIPSSVQSDVPHSLFPLSVSGLGELRIFVPEDRLTEAREFLAEHRRQGMKIVNERSHDDANGPEGSSTRGSSSGTDSSSDEEPPARRRDEGEGR